jgi:hypothetical protein
MTQYGYLVVEGPHDEINAKLASIIVLNNYLFFVHDKSRIFFIR